MARPRRAAALWLFTTRYLSGGALGMNAFSAWSLLQLGSGQSAADRPDIFGAYAHMNEAVLERDLNYRRARAMRMGDGAAREFSTMLAAACDSRARLTLFFPPDNMAIVERYRQSDAAGLDAFKQTVRDAVARHNAACTNKASVVRLHGAERAHHRDAEERPQSRTMSIWCISARRPACGCSGRWVSAVSWWTRSRSWWGSWRRCSSNCRCWRRQHNARNHQDGNAADQEQVVAMTLGFLHAGRLAGRKRQLRHPPGPGNRPSPPRPQDPRPPS